MTVEELAVIVKEGFDRMEKQFDGLYDSREKFSDECRKRHTEIDKSLSAQNVRQSIVGVIAVAIASAIAGLVSWIQR